MIRTDNGVPFCGPGSVLGLSTLSVWFLKLGIRLERSRPGETLGFEPIADGLWSVFFGDVLLGRFSDQGNRFTAGSGR